MPDGKKEITLDESAGVDDACSVNAEEQQNDKDVYPSKVVVKKGQMRMPRSQDFTVNNLGYLVEFPIEVPIGSFVDALMNLSDNFLVNGINKPIITRPDPMHKRYVRKTRGQYSKRVLDVLPDKSVDFVEANWDMYWEYIYKRQYYYHNRYELKLPRNQWTDDDIILRNKTFNVYRELNDNALFQVKNIILPHQDDPKLMFWYTLMFRFFYNWKTYEYCGLPHYKDWDPDEFYKDVIAYKTYSGTPFTCVYTVTPPPINSSNGEIVMEDTIKYYVDSITWVHEHLDELYGYISTVTAPSAVWEKLKEVPIFGDFISHEVYNDLVMCKSIFKWTNNDFVFAGPGARFTLRLIWPNKDNMPTDEAFRTLFEASHRELNKFDKPFPYLIDNGVQEYPDGYRLTLKALEDNLCQFSKYWRARHEVGRLAKRSFE